MGWSKGTYLSVKHVPDMETPVKFNNGDMTEKLQQQQRNRREEKSPRGIEHILVLSISDDGSQYWGLWAE